MLLTTNPPNSLSVNDAKTHCYPLHFDLISCLRGQKSRLIGLRCLQTPYPARPFGNIVEKEKMLVTSIFSCFHNVF